MTCPHCALLPAEIREKVIAQQRREIEELLAENQRLLEGIARHAADIDPQQVNGGRDGH